MLRVRMRFVVRRFRPFAVGVALVAACNGASAEGLAGQAELQVARIDLQRSLNCLVGGEELRPMPGDASQASSLTS